MGNTAPYDATSFIRLNLLPLDLIIWGFPKYHCYYTTKATTKKLFLIEMSAFRIFPDHLGHTLTNLINIPHMIYSQFAIYLFFNVCAHSINIASLGLLIIPFQKQYPNVSPKHPICISSKHQQKSCKISFCHKYCDFVNNTLNLSFFLTFS